MPRSRKMLFDRFHTSASPEQRVFVCVGLLCGSSSMERPPTMQPAEISCSCPTFERTSASEELANFLRPKLQQNRKMQANSICYLHRFSNIFQSRIHGLAATATKKSLRLRLGRSDRQAPWLERPQQMGMVRIFQFRFSTISACSFPSSLSAHQPETLQAPAMAAPRPSKLLHRFLHKDP